MKTKNVSVSYIIHLMIDFSVYSSRKSGWSSVISQVGIAAR